MMSSPKIEIGLPQRLERLTGEEARCCVPSYKGLASELRDSRGFAPALLRARALADDNRLLALAFLKRRGEVCACEVQAVTGLTHATVSHHMTVLEDAGWVVGRRRGKWMYYRLTPNVRWEIP